MNLEQVICFLNNKIAYNKNRIEKIDRLLKRRSAQTWSLEKSKKMFRRLETARSELQESQMTLEQITVQETTKSHE